MQLFSFRFLLFSFIRPTSEDASAFRGVLNAAGKAAEQPPPQQLVQSKVGPRRTTRFRAFH